MKINRERDSKLTDFGKSIMLDRYLLKGESFQDLFKRVASYYADNEEHAQRIYDYMSKLWFMPATPVLANGGTDRGLPISCLAGDTPIITINGCKNIQDIQIGDLVLTHKGKFKKVINTKKSQSSDIYELQTSIRTTKLQITGNHLVYTNRGWVRVDELNPICDFIATNEKIINTESKDYYINIDNSNNIVKFGKFARTKINENVLISEDLAWALGFWFAQGSSNNNGTLRVTHNVIEPCIKWCQIMSKAFNVKGSSHQQRSWFNGDIYSKTLVEYFDKTFGKGSRNKSLPTWLIDLPVSHLKQFYDGLYLGDGFKTSVNKAIELSNQNLIAGVSIVLSKIGIKHTMQLKKKSVYKKELRYNGIITECNTNPTKISINGGGISFADGLCYGSIKKLEKINTPAIDVYDLEVEEDHSFSAAGIVVHNCFLNEMEDSLQSIADTYNENIYLASSGGGIGTNISNVRSINEAISNDKGKSSGIMPFVKVIDSLTLAISQGSLRRGSSAVYLDISHPEIEEFIDVRRPTGGDLNRKCLNIHHGITIPDAFMQAVEKGEEWELKSPVDNKVISTVSARELWIKILNARIETGEPYIFFTDAVNRGRTEVQKALDLKIKASNLCVAPETLILVKDLGWVDIKSVANKEVEIWNGFEWSLVVPRKTGENQQLLKVKVKKSFDGRKLPYTKLQQSNLIDEWITINCTEYHKWYIKPKGIFANFKKPVCKRTFELKDGDEIVSYSIPHQFFYNGGKQEVYKKENFKVFAKILDVSYTDRISDTYCFTEPKRNMAVFNGILTGQCSEITLPTGKDHSGELRTAVCCLSSLNLEYYEEWGQDKNFIPDIMRFLDNVLSDFIKKAPKSMKNAVYSATRERSVGLGVMGFHSFLQKKMIPIEGVMAKSWNKKMFKYIKEEADKASIELAKEKGACPDALDAGMNERFSTKIAIAPTASISVIAGNTSPGIEPFVANAFTQKTLSGSFVVKNKYLKELLASKGKDTVEVWSSITTNGGSVLHLPFLTEDEKSIFKTAYEIDQMWLVEHSADRTPFICQAQSFNVFLSGNIDKLKLHKIHFASWKKGLKTMYYCRSTSVQRADTVSNFGAKAKNEKDGEECIACQ